MGMITCEFILNYTRMDRVSQVASSIFVAGTNFVADLDMGRADNGTTVSLCLNLRVPKLTMLNRSICGTRLEPNNKSGASRRSSESKDAPYPVHHLI